LLEIRRISGALSVGILDLAAFSKDRGPFTKRELEKAGAQHLLTELLKPKSFILRYNEFNKPFLEGEDRHISISHSHNKLAICVNDRENTGIDIELIRDKVLNIQKKFLSPEEMGFATNDVDKLLTIWAGKEALYKVYGNKELVFARDIGVSDPSGGPITGTLHFGGETRKFRLVAENIDNYKMVYVLNEL
jgi:4'-phosphopantetheinyl transferase